MVRSAFSEHGISELTVFSGNQDSAKYIRTLQNFPSPFATETYEGFWEFQKDNAPIRNWNAREIGQKNKNLF